MLDLALDGDRGSDIIPAGDLPDGQNVPVAQKNILMRVPGKRCGDLDFAMLADLLMRVMDIEPG